MNEEQGHQEVYVLETSKGYTESLGAEAIQTLVRLGLIRHTESRYVVSTQVGGIEVGLGPMHHFYVPVDA